MSAAKATRREWVVRALIASSIGVSTGLAAHVMMGGQLPGLLGVLPAGLVTMALGLVALRQPTVVGAVVTAVVGQWLTHEMMVLGASAPILGHHAHTPVVWEPTMLADAPMAAGHLVAAIVTALAIVLAHRIIAAFHSFAYLLRRHVDRWLALFLADCGAPPADIRPLFSGPNRARSVFTRGERAPRGPPLAAH